MPIVNQTVAVWKGSADPIMRSTGVPGSWISTRYVSANVVIRIYNDDMVKLGLRRYIKEWCEVLVKNIYVKLVGLAFKCPGLGNQ